MLPGAREKQLADLLTLGMVPDEIVIQSERHADHEAAFQRALREGAVYPCTCSRAEVRDDLAGMASASHRMPSAGALLYSGRCRLTPHPTANPNAEIAWRFRHPQTDGTQDFIIARAALDGTRFTPSYHWACAWDDWEGGYALLVRAHDLASATPTQRALQRMFAQWTSGPQTEPAFPAVYHASLITQNDGHRLEKRTRGVTLDELTSAGFSPSLLLGHFGRSFSETDFRLNASEIRGEPRTSLTLDELGISTT